MRTTLVFGILVATAGCGTEDGSAQEQASGNRPLRSVSTLNLEYEPPGETCSFGGTRFVGGRDSSSSRKLVSCIGVGGTSAPASSVPASIPRQGYGTFVEWCLDPDLDHGSRTTIQAILSKEKYPDCKTAGEKLESKESLTLSGLGLTSLSPVGSLKNLKNLYVSKNNITDLSPLRGLSELKNLQADNNSIADVSALAGLTNLLTLNLSNNRIRNVSPLARLPKITRLHLTGNQISNAWPLASLPPSAFIYLTGNPLESQVFNLK